MNNAYQKEPSSFLTIYCILCIIWILHSMSAKPSRKPKKPIKTTRPLKKHSKTIEKTKKKQKNQGHRRQICYASPCGHISRVSLDPWFFLFFFVFSMVLLWFWTGPLGFFQFFWFSRWFCSGSGKGESAAMPWLIFLRFQDKIYTNLILETYGSYSQDSNKKCIQIWSGGLLAHIPKILTRNVYKSDLGDFWLIFSRF